MNDFNVNTLRADISTTIMRLVVQNRLDKKWLFLLIDGMPCVSLDCLSKGPLYIPIFEGNNFCFELECSVVALAILFKKRTYFAHLFHELWETERRYVRRFGCDYNNLWYHINTNDILTPFLTQNFRYSVRLLCQVQYLLHPNCGQLWEAHKELILQKHIALENILSFSPAPNVTRRVHLLPVFSTELLLQLSLQRAGLTEHQQRALQKMILSFIMNRSVREKARLFKKWITPASFPILLRLMHHELNPFIGTLHAPKHVYKPKQRGLMFQVDTASIQWTLVSAGYHKCRLRLISGREIQCILSTRDKNRLSSESHAILVRTGCRFNDVNQLGSRLQQHLSRFHNRIPNLVFSDDMGQVHRSNGVLAPVSEFTHFTPVPRFASVPPLDVTHHFDVAVRKRRYSKRRRRPIPFSLNCHLTTGQVRELTHGWKSWPLQSKLLFFKIFWFIGYWNFEHYMDNEEVRLIEGWMDRFIRYKQSVTGPTRFEVYFPNYQRQLWCKLTVLTRKPNIRAHAVLNNFQHRHLYAILDSHDCPDTVNHVLKCISKNAWVVESLKVGSEPQVRGILAMPGIPAALKRVLYHSCMLSGFSIDSISREQIMLNTTRPDAYIGPLDVSLAIKLPFIGNMDQYAPIWISRDTCAMHNYNEIRRISKISLTPDFFDVRVRGEPAFGIAVYKECMLMLWNRGIQRGWIDEYDDSGMCIASREDEDMKTATARETNQYFFTLGFISAICVSRGLFLPYPLCHDFWSYLTYDRKYELILDTVFLKGAKMWDKIQSQSLEEFMHTYGAERHEVDTVYKRMTYTYKLYRPCMDYLSEFYQGWQSIMARMPIHNFGLRQLTDIFCEPAVTEQYTYDDFVKVFTVNDVENDNAFLDIVKTLTQAQLTKLVHFITGKKKLPLMFLGEYPIQVKWDGTQDPNIPIAQNCVNTLVFADDMDIDNLKAVMQVIFEYDTVYGYA